MKTLLIGLLSSLLFFNNSFSQENRTNGNDCRALVSFEAETGAHSPMTNLVGTIFTIKDQNNFELFRIESMEYTMEQVMGIIESNLEELIKNGTCSFFDNYFHY